MSRQYLSKEEEIFSHASKRMLERFDIVFSRQIERELILKIKKGEAVFEKVRTENNVYKYMNSKIYSLHYEGKRIRVCIGVTGNRYRVLTVY